MLRENCDLLVSSLRVFSFSYRVQYQRWKDVCRELDSHVGSGIVVTAPLVTEDGQPIKDPLVLMEASPNQIPSQRSQVDSGAESTDPLMNKEVISWKLTLHQIGTFHFYLFHAFAMLAIIHFYLSCPLICFCVTTSSLTLSVNISAGTVISF